MHLLCIQPPTTAVSLRLACRFSLIDPNHRSPSFLSFLPLCRSIDRFENHWFPCMQRWMLMFLSRSHFPPYLGYILQPCMVIGPQSRDTEITARASMMRLDHRLAFPFTREPSQCPGKLPLIGNQWRFSTLRLDPIPLHQEREREREEKPLCTQSQGQKKSTDRAQSFLPDGVIFFCSFVSGYSGVILN